MEWLLGIYIMIITAYANVITNKHTEVEKDRNQWRKKAIKLNAELMRLEGKKHGNT